MFALTGKLFDWSTKEVGNRIIVTVVLTKKHKDKDSFYAFSTFSERIKELLEQRLVGSGDSVEIKFFVKSREYNGRWYTDMYADEMMLLKKGKSASMNMFEGKAKSFR